MRYTNHLLACLFTYFTSCVYGWPPWCHIVVHRLPSRHSPLCHHQKIDEITPASWHDVMLPVKGRCCNTYTAAPKSAAMQTDTQDGAATIYWRPCGFRPGFRGTYI